VRCRATSPGRWPAGCGWTMRVPPTVLVSWRARLRASDRPRRLLEAVGQVVEATGVLKGRGRRVLDSTILADAVATQDTVTQLVAAIGRVRRLVPQARGSSWNISCATRSFWPVITGGRPPCRPRTRAAASPALVRSRIRSRSNSASAANTWKTSLPPGVVVSIASWRLQNPTPRSASPVTVSTKWRSDRPSRSSFQTTRVSPGRSWSRSCSRVGRSVRVPLAVSVKTR
jgi:hypothetical protein